MPEKPITIKEIAWQLGISPSAVSRALHDHPSIGRKTKQQVKELAEKLNYVPNQTALFFKEGKTRTVGVILPFLGEEFFSKAISGIEDIAMDNGYTVLIGQSRDNAGREQTVVNAMARHRVDGLIVSIAKDTMDFSHFEALQKYHIPIVFFDRVPAMDNVSYVRCNLKKGTREAMDLLISRGHTRIGLLNGPTSLTASLERQDGYIAALEHHQIKIDRGLIKHSSLDTECTESAVKEMMAIKKSPTAILVFNDYTALDVIRYLKQQKLRINRDVTVVSFANISINYYLNDAPLASVEQFPGKQGEKAMEILLKNLNRGKEVDNLQLIIDTKLVLHNDMA